jgi:hypothetical protein
MKVVYYFPLGNVRRYFSGQAIGLLVSKVKRTLEFKNYEGDDYSTKVQESLMLLSLFRIAQKNRIELTDILTQRCLCCGNY